MSKTVPQLKKIDRSDSEKVEQISQPYAWQQKQAAQQKPVAQQKPAAKPAPAAADPFVKTVPAGNPARRRSR